MPRDLFEESGISLQKNEPRDLFLENEIQFNPETIQNESFGKRIGSAVIKGITDIPEQLYGLGKAGYKFASEPQKAPERLFNLSKGAGQGLGNAAIGFTQLAANIGEDAARRLEKQIYGDNILPENSQSTFAGRLNKKTKELLQEQEKLPTSQKIGIGLGEQLPYLMSAGASIPKAVAATGIGSFLAPQQENNITNRAVDATENMVSGLGTSAAFQAAPILAGGSKMLTQKALGITPKSQETLRAFEEAGVNPRLADISESRTTKNFQNLLGNFPGSAGRIEKAAQQQVDNIVKQLAGVTKSEGGTIQEAGQKIKEGAQNFITRSSEKSEQLYKKVDEMVPAATPVSLNNAFNALNDRRVQITSSVHGGETAGYVKFLNEIQQGMQEGKQIPYDALAALRSEMGYTLRDANLKPVERSAINKIYEGLTNDIKDAVKTADLGKIGTQSALKAWERANLSHATRKRFIEKNITPLLDKEIPEKIYEAALAGTKKGGTNVSGLMKVLNPNQKEFIRGTIVKRMGLQNPGGQDFSGEVFSPAKFLTEWNKIDSPINREAAESLFNETQINSVRKLNKAISSIKDSAKSRQTSNNLPYYQLLGLSSLASGTAAAKGVIAGAGAVAVPIIGANITARMMTNPQFLNWLAKAPSIRPSQIPAHLKQLSVIAGANPEIRKDVLDYIQDITLEKENE